MNSALSLLTSYLVNSVWEIAVIGGAGWLVSRSVKRLGPQAQHLIWVATLVLSIVAPATPLYFLLVGNAHLVRNPQAHSVVMASTASAGLFPAHSGIAPVAWMIKSQLSQTREMICDRMASEKFLSPHKYAQSLIRLATSMPPRPRSVTSHAVGIFNANTLEERIMTLRAKQRPAGPALKIGLATSATCLLALVAVASGTLARPVEAQPTPFSTKSDSAKKSLKHKKLECTYYDPQGIAYDGTCGTAKGNKKDYRCFLNNDRSVSQPQIGCAGKVNK